MGRQPIDRVSLAAAALVAELVEGAGEAFDGLLHLGQEIEPGLVSDTSRVVRDRSFTPRSSSSLRIRWLRAVCDRFRWAAACWKLPRSGDGDENMEAQEVDTHAGVSDVGC